MRKFLLLPFISILSFSLPAFAQDPLPHIQVKNINGRIVVSWVNQYKRVAKVVNIQRSYDSLKNYTSIGSVLNPENIDNGYADTKAPYNNMYYRVFVAFEGGSYAFSEVKRPGKLPAVAALTPGDSIALHVVKPPVVVVKKLSHIYLGRENNVIIDLPDAELKKYSIKFFDEKDALVFEINKLHEKMLILEKVNFIRAGWYHFELYEKGLLLEKDKFYLPTDDKPFTVPEADKKNKR
jgi:hypothetical protein